MEKALLTQSPSTCSEKRRELQMPNEPDPELEKLVDSLSPTLAKPKSSGYSMDLDDPNFNPFESKKSLPNVELSPEEVSPQNLSVQIEKAKNRPRITRATSPKFATNSRARLRGARDENRPQLKEKTKRRARVGAPQLATAARGFQFRTSKRAELKLKPTEQMTFTARKLTSDESMRKAHLGHTIKKLAKRECTVPESPRLNSKSRAKSRAAFDRAVDARRKIKEEERLERERIEKEKDDQRLIEERRALVHKPTAIRGQTPPPKIQPSDKTFTQPESPQFRTSARLRARQNKKNGVSNMEH